MRPSLALVLAGLLVAACGGRLGAEASGADGGPPFDAGVTLPVTDSGTPPSDGGADVTDAASCVGPDASSCDAIFTLIVTQVDGSPHPCSFGPAWTFFREKDFVDFFEQVAVDAGLCTSFASCSYDPLGPCAADASPGTCPNDLGEFVGPDGLDYAFTLVRTRNVYLLVRKDRNPSGYALVAAANACLAPDAAGE
jgi:hypothetical protein